ncbi:MAG: imidazoleglycerol-phosphate dehydratase HisB [Deltaproteobacteria bacterium]|nr:imidazoleglycerol-phosphate dehydratase HisB [Deltaproteobacteria bacterium]
MCSERQATVIRKTKETNIEVELLLDGKGAADIHTGVPFMDHMLTLVAGHGFLDLRIHAEGDLEVDAHHTIEDLGICLGKALNQALGSKEGIKRFGCAYVPLDEALARAVVDLCNRPFLAYRVSPKESRTGTFDVHLLREFFRALVLHSGMTLHIDLLAGIDAHHVAESICKSFAKALDQASSPEPRLQGRVPSTKGLL